MSATAPEKPGFRLNLSTEDKIALGLVLAAVLILFAVIGYCPSYQAGKISFFSLWTSTFWYDIKDQIEGLLSGHPKGNLSADAAESEWNYCGAVPFIVAWLVWQMKDKLQTIPVKGHPAGWAVLGAGFTAYLLGFLMENYYVGMGALQLIYAGLILLFLGWETMRVLIFPWAFILFMWPYNFMEDIALNLRLVMSGLSHHVLQLFGVANELRGTAIMSPADAKNQFAIDIADPCSGIRSLFALVMIAAVYAFISFEKLWQQCLIVAMAVPMVIVGNLVRILVLTYGTIHWGQEFALGSNDAPSRFHEGAGYLVYIINFGGLILFGTFLGRLTSLRKSDA